jgi:SAM-dependent MidA family methyltransferase
VKTGQYETIERFMERALHDPVRGYYARNIRSIGSRGDFTTAPQISAAPAKAIAAWIARALRETKTRDVIEIGPGLGTLSAQTISELPPLLRLRTRFHLVESSPALSAHQKKLLGNKVRHHTTIQSALDACSGEAIIFSNELVDAFPVRVFRKTKEAWCEIALLDSAEILLPPAELPPSSVFTIDFLDGQTVEVHDSYRLWLETWLPHWQRGEMLTIDYGSTVESLYDRRPRGTLRAYLFHQLLDGAAVFQNAGLQDITADVNFTDLVAWAEPWLQSLTPQRFSDFIHSHAVSSGTHFSEATAPFCALIQKPRR